MQKYAHLSGEYFLANRNLVVLLADLPENGTFFTTGKEKKGPDHF